MKKNYRNLGEFIKELEKENELLHFRLPVSNILEITEITDRMSKLPGGGRAILFENVPGYGYPVLMNQFGSMKRISMALGTESLDSLAERLQDIINTKPPKTFIDKLKLLPRLINLSRFFPKTVKGKAPCQEVITTGTDVDLGKLPVLKCWPDDGGPFITLPVVFTKGLYDGKRNAGMYRMQVYDKNTTGMHWHIHKDGAHHYHEYFRADRRMEVAVAVGTDPAVTYAATAPLPRGIDEMILAGFIRQKPVEMVKCITVNIEVPAEAEFIIEGYVDPGELHTEGPFGDHTGYYSLKGEYPVFHVTAITHRKNPVYSATVVGRPPMEDCYMAHATERLFLPMIKTVLPEITDYTLPWEGVFHNIAIVAIDKEFPGQAVRVMNGLWGSGQMSFSKMLVLVDNRSILRDRNMLMKNLLDNVDINSDIILTEGILDVLDHSADRPLYGSKIGIDATQRLDCEEKRTGNYIHGKTGPGLLEARTLSADKKITAVRIAFNECRNRLILITVKKDKKQNSAYFMKKLKNSIIKNEGIIIIYDHEIDINNDSLILWKLFNNVDPARDIIIEKGCMLIDATRKGMHDGHSRDWPDDIIMSRDVVEKISAILKTEKL